MTKHCNLEPVENEADDVSYAGLYLQQGADKDGADRQTVAGGHGGQGPGHPHLAPLDLSPRLQHSKSGQVRSGQVNKSVATYELSLRNELDLGSDGCNRKTSKYIFVSDEIF